MSRAPTPDRWGPDHEVECDDVTAGIVFAMGGVLVCPEKREQRQQVLNSASTDSVIGRVMYEQIVKEYSWLVGINQCRLDPGHIYFIEAPELSRVKVGFTRNVRSRFTGLRNAAPCELRLLGSVRGVPSTEWAFHQFLGHRRVYGEWFSIDDDVVIAVRAARHYGDPGEAWKPGLLGDMRPGTLARWLNAATAEAAA